MVKKIVSILLATSLVIGGGITKASASTIDDLYKAAYECTMKAVQNKNQASINEARQAIGKLPKELKAAIGEFSKLVDRPQQELFERFMGVLFDSRGNKKDYSIVDQDEINVARGLIIQFATYEGNKPYINSWSSALDECQQCKIDVARNSLEYAEMVKTKLAKENAQNLIDKLLRVSGNDTVLNYAKELQKRVTAIVVNNTDPTNPTNPTNPTDPNVGYRPELDKTDGKDHNTDPTSYRQHIRFSSIDGKSYYEKIYNTSYGNWERYNLTFDNPSFGNDYEVASISYFSGNNQTDFRGWGPCVASFIKVHSFKDSSKNYAELIRIADGFVLEKIDSKGNKQVFNAPLVSQQALNDFNSMNYDTLMNKWMN